MAEPLELVKKSLQRKPTSDYTSLELGKLPPQARELEEAVLGGVMMDTEAMDEISDILLPESFYLDHHQRIWRACQTLHQARKPIDLLTVTEQLKKTGELETVGGPFVIAQLTNKVGSGAHAEYHARIIAEKYVQRLLISTSTEIVKEAYEDTTDVFELLDSAQASLSTIAMRIQGNASTDFHDTVWQMVDDMKAAATRGDGMTGIITGSETLNRHTGGWEPEQLIVVAARPSMGKTAWAMCMAVKQAEKGIPVGVFTLEMSAGALSKRMLSGVSGISSYRVRQGFIQESEWQTFERDAATLSGMPIYMHDQGGITVEQIKTISRKWVREKGVKCIYIDYLQLIAVREKKYGNGNREQDVSEISRNLKALAKELKVPVIAISQLSRAPETRGGLKKPILSDLRESGAIEQDADIVIFLYRGEYYGFVMDEDGDSAVGIAEVIIAKMREGATGTIRQTFNEATTWFSDAPPKQHRIQPPVTPPTEERKSKLRPMRDVTGENNNSQPPF